MEGERTCADPAGIAAAAAANNSSSNSNTSEVFKFVGARSFGVQPCATHCLEGKTGKYWLRGVVMRYRSMLDTHMLYVFLVGSARGLYEALARCCTNAGVVAGSHIHGWATALTSDGNDASDGIARHMRPAGVATPSDGYRRLSDAPTHFNHLR